jgi:hypothetical protein
MLAPLVLSVLIVLVVGGLVWAAMTRERPDETERFNRARAITSSWADPVAGPEADPQVAGKPFGEPVSVPGDVRAEQQG